MPEMVKDEGTQAILDAVERDMRKAEEALKPTRYPVSPEVERRFENTYTYHAPKGDQAERYVALRDEARALAVRIVNLTPPGREQALALTKLEEVVFWANAAIARGEK